MGFQTIQRRFKHLHHQGKSWTAIGAMFDRSAAWASRIARGDYEMNDHLAEMVEPYLPLPLWETRDDLEDLVYDKLDINWPTRLTGKELGLLCGTCNRTIRSSIKRLREKGHNISASLAPPRGYQLSGESRGIKDGTTTTGT